LRDAKLQAAMKSRGATSEGHVQRQTLLDRCVAGVRYLLVHR